MASQSAAPNQQTDEAEFTPKPEEQAARWSKELDAAETEIKKWHREGDSVVDVYLDERKDTETDEVRWNLFNSDIQTRQAILYGRPPQVSVSRRFADADDDVGRVAAEMLERLLNQDLEIATDGAAAAYEAALQDRLLPGMAFVRLRYSAKFEPAPSSEELLEEDSAAPALPDTGVAGDEQESPMQSAIGAALEQPEPEQEEPEDAEPDEVKVSDSEAAETDYIHWRDHLWSAEARTFSEIRWWAFREKLSRKQARERFPDDADKLPYAKADKDAPDETKSPWDRVEIWEIWSKEDRKVYWWVKGYARILDAKADPLGLQGFWPFPRPMVANLTTRKFVPRPDYKLAQDLYREINTLSQRIDLLTQAVKVGGAYDANTPQLEKLLDDTKGNILVPVTSWAAFAEKGGLQGAVSWFPIEAVVAALDKLREIRSELVNALYQLTGMSDIMRGQASSGDATATEQRIKARASGVRMQATEQEFARFVSDAQRIKAEIISLHFDVETIIQRSNVLATPDAELAQQAAALIKSKFLHFRVEVQSESLAQTDFAALKAERTEVLGAISEFISSAGPLAQQLPTASITLLEVLAWALSGLKGSQEIQGVIDRAIAAAKQQAAQAAANPQPAPPDPKTQQLQMKAQLDSQKAAQDHQNDLERIQAEVQAHATEQAIQTQENVRQVALTERIKREHAAAATPIGGV